MPFSYSTVFILLPFKIAKSAQNHSVLLENLQKTKLLLAATRGWSTSSLDFQQRQSWIHKYRLDLVLGFGEAGFALPALTAPDCIRGLSLLFLPPPRHHDIRRSVQIIRRFAGSTIIQENLLRLSWITWCVMRRGATTRGLLDGPGKRLEWKFFQTVLNDSLANQSVSHLILECARCYFFPSQTHRWPLAFCIHSRLIDSLTAVL